MRKIAILLAGALSLAGCESDLSNLVLPMEPSPESIAAPRRALTDKEQETIFNAVSVEVKDPSPQDFVWAPLVIRAHDGVTDYCGIVKKNSGDPRDPGVTKFYSQIRFDSRGQIARVDVKSVAKNADNNVPTAVDSICMLDGYSSLPAVK